MSLHEKAFECLTKCLNCVWESSVVDFQGHYDESEESMRRLGADLEQVMLEADMHGHVSHHESMDEVKTVDMKFILCPFLLAELTYLLPGSADVQWVTTRPPTQRRRPHVQSENVEDIPVAAPDIGSSDEGAEPSARGVSLWLVGNLAWMTVSQPMLEPCATERSRA